MSLSKVHYDKIAMILKECIHKDEIIISLALYFKQDNPSFNTAKFLKVVYADA